MYKEANLCVMTKRLICRSNFNYAFGIAKVQYETQSLFEISDKGLLNINVKLQMNCNHYGIVETSFKIKVGITYIHSAIELFDIAKLSQAPAQALLAGIKKVFLSSII